MAHATSTTIPFPDSSALDAAAAGIDTGQATGAITATLVLPEHRMAFLPKHFGSAMLLAENAIYDAMGMLCSAYRGGFWDYLELSNGGCYMRPQSPAGERWRVTSPNGHEAELSADAAGLLATLFGINGLTFQGQDQLVDAYYGLLDFAREHAEAVGLNQALD